MNKSISRWIYKNRIHLLVWSLFMIYEIGVIGLYVGKFGHPVSYLSHYILIILLFYTHSNILLKWALANNIKSIWRLPLILTFAVSVYIVSNFYLDQLLMYYKIAPANSVAVLNWRYAFQVIYRCIYILGFSTAYYFLATYLRERNLKEGLEKERLLLIINQERMQRALSKAHNDFLKAQINPHFLFNTLDYVYQNISINSPNASEAILTLSDMMRYAVDNNEQKEFILLGEEVEQVEKLVYLYQLRKNMELNIIIDISDEVKKTPFIPLVLITLVENVFKHGNVSNQEIGIYISARIEESNIVLETINALNLKPKSSTSLNSGLKNIRERLHFAYGHEVNASFRTVGDTFVSKIAIPLNIILRTTLGNQITAHESTRNIN
ncbi:sensor histidine kinase [Pedobacter jeongneungensis]|uniref:sensor histidine kinase n=1 Tax=Pedobacter jeongneungensis TaxID=947309 RepID=UPI000A04DB9D|nr:histidine kinase [Pedobacter jeongneungensis]